MVSITKDNVRIITLNEIKALPSVSIDEKRLLPREAGLYFVIMDGKVVYIGQSTQLNTRWQGHEKAKYVQGSRIYYYAIGKRLINGSPEHKQLIRLEGTLIDSFQPELNDVDIVRYWREEKDRRIEENKKLAEMEKAYRQKIGNYWENYQTEVDYE